MRSARHGLDSNQIGVQFSVQFSVASVRLGFLNCLRLYVKMGQVKEEGNHAF